MGIFQKLFGIAKREDPFMAWIRKDNDDDDADLPSRFGGENYSSQSQPTSFGDLLKLKESHPWVAACVSRISETMAAIPWRFLTKTKQGKWVQVPGDYPWDDMFEKPNRYQTWDAFMRQVWDFMSLTGNGPIEIVRDVDGNPLELYALRPDRFGFVSDPKKYVSEYTYEVETGRASAKIAPENLLWLKTVSTLGDYWGVSQLLAGVNALTLDFYAVAFNKTDIKDGQKVGDAYEFEDGLGKPAKHRFEADLRSRHSGPGNVGKSIILDDGQKINRAPVSRYDLHYENLRRMSREEVLACYAMPPAMVGLFGISGAPGIREQRSIFYENVIMPRLLLFQNAVNGFLLPRDVMFEFVTTDIVALIEDLASRHADERADLNAGLLTINEVRGRRGLSPVPWGNVWQASLGIAAIDAPVRQQIAAPPQAMGEEESAKADEVPEPDWSDDRQVKRWQKFVAWKAALDPDERKIKSAFSSWLADAWKRQEKALEENLKPRMVSATVKISKADVDDSWLLLIGEETQRLKRLLSPKAKEIATKHANITIKDIRTEVARQVKVNPAFVPPATLPVVFNVARPAFNEFLADFDNIRIKTLTTQTAELARQEISAGLDAGEDFDAIKNRVQRFYSGPLAESRARAVARTEAVTLANQGRSQAMEEAGIEKRKWVSALLSSTRESHRAAHGQIKKTGEKFEIGTRSGGVEFMNEPGDPAGSAENVTNCVLDAQIPIMTVDGWKRIKDIIPGDLVLTHRGRFRRVLRLSRRAKYAGMATRISFRATGAGTAGLTSVFLTDRHPILMADGTWKPVCEVGPGDQAMFASKPCENCLKPIPVVRTYGRDHDACSRHCHSQLVMSRNKTINARRLEFLSNARRSLRNRIEREPGLRFKITNSANDVTREKVRNGEFILQHRHGKSFDEWFGASAEKMKIAASNQCIKNHQRMARLTKQSKGGSNLERRVADLLTDAGVVFVRQHPILRRGNKRVYVADFFLPKYGIVIEANGCWYHGCETCGHSEKAERRIKDAQRDMEIESQGMQVLHIWGHEMTREKTHIAREKIQRLVANHEGQYGIIAVTVESVKTYRLPKSRTAYNFAVEEDESYIVKGLASHNCLCQVESVFDWEE